MANNLHGKLEFSGYPLTFHLSLLNKKQGEPCFLGEESRSSSLFEGLYGRDSSLLRSSEWQWGTVR